MKSYEDGTLTQTFQQVNSQYSITHPLFKQCIDSNHSELDTQRLILNLISNQKSIWIDSFGRGLSPDFISIEQDQYSIALENFSNVYFRKDLNNIKTHNELMQTFNPEIVVYYKSEFFKYLTVPELVSKITELVYVYGKLIIYIDTVFMDYNKLKYPINNVIIQMRKLIPGARIKRQDSGGILINI
jgi:hypothetical protein